jgi:AraC-like DNA-binding protein
LATVSATYVDLVLRLAESRGVPASTLLRGLDFPLAWRHEPQARMPMRPQFAELCRRAMALTGEPGLGCEFGLQAQLTSHGAVGFGYLAQTTLRTALAFAERFGSGLRLAAWQVQVDWPAPEAGPQGEVRVQLHERVPRTDLYRMSAEMVLVSSHVLLSQLLPACRPEVSLHFAFAEPPWHARYAARLPRCVFNAELNELRLPARWLDVPLAQGDRTAAQWSAQACEAELNELKQTHSVKPDDPWLAQVQAWLVPNLRGFPSQAMLADRLGMPVRSLSRQLATRGTTYRALLQAAQRAHADALLGDASLPLHEVALRLGYSTAANLARACRAWHGQTPAQVRAHLLAASARSVD